MSIAYDLPGCMSNIQESHCSPDLSGPSCETASHFKRSFTSPSPNFRRDAIALAIPAALLASTVLSSADQQAAKEVSAPVTYAVRSSPEVSIDVLPAMPHSVTLIPWRRAGEQSTTVCASYSHLLCNWTSVSAALRPPNRDFHGLRTAGRESLLVL